jgi:NhaP-type Na+/H+ or K+/H+ antiporter
MSIVTIFIVLIFLHSLISERLGKSPVTAPIVFTAAGMVTFLCVPELRDRQVNMDVWLRIAETGLVMLLFTDASRTDLRILKHIRNLPVRLLSTGMLLTILLGGLCALVVFRKLSIWEAGILAAILAPTDAGLGQIIVCSPRVPTGIRQALNVEAGLNDGMAVPFLLFFIALAGTGESGRGALTNLIVEQLGYGTLVGAGIGLLGGWMLNVAHQRNWIAHSWQQFGVVALPLLCMVASEAVGASMFIAAFVAGLAVQVGFRDAGKHSVAFTEDWGQLLNLAVFFFFGIRVARAWPEFGMTHLAYAILSLTVVRMVPVALALIGTRLSRATVLFMGWFGPRGLASIVLGLIYMEEKIHTPGANDIRLAVMVTVLLSIFTHGLTASPGIARYARRIETMGSDAPERQESAV